MSTPAQYLGTGKRKTSVARVILRPGSGATWVNGRTMEEYFPRMVHRMLATAPLKTAGLDGQYYGVQGMTWKSPPILDDASSTTRMRGRTYKLFYDGTRLRLVAWSTPRAVYWISNTLSETLTSKQMLAIARSLTRFGGK